MPEYPTLTHPLTHRSHILHPSLTHRSPIAHPSLTHRSHIAHTSLTHRSHIAHPSLTNRPLIDILILTFFAFLREKQPKTSYLVYHPFTNTRTLSSVSHKYRPLLVYILEPLHAPKKNSYTTIYSTISSSSSSPIASIVEPFHLPTASWLSGSYKVFSLDIKYSLPS